MRRRVRLDQTRARLERWRAQHGGRGIPVPEGLWAEAVEVARVEGVVATARELRLDRSRLAARMPPTGAAASGEVAAEVGGGFVELDAGRLGLSPRTVVRLEGRDGERLEVELGAGMMVDVAALVDAFWRRRGECPGNAPTRVTFARKPSGTDHHVPAAVALAGEARPIAL